MSEYDPQLNVAAAQQNLSQYLQQAACNQIGQSGSLQQAGLQQAACNQHYVEVLATAPIPPHAESWPAVVLGPGNHPAVIITFDPPSIEVDPDLDWNTAAKCFWNAVYRMSGRAALFPDL